jgi:hypothetical protein
MEVKVMTKESWQIAANIAQVVTGATSIVAIFIAPWVALRLQRQRDTMERRRDRKMHVFRTLMTNRATPMSPPFVEALNSIDLEFDSTHQRDKSVRRAWSNLLDHYSNGARGDNFALRGQELTIKLLSEMGSAVGYDDLDEVYLTRHSYYPIALSSVIEEQHELRKLLLQLLKDERRLPVSIFPDDFPEIH